MYDYIQRALIFNGFGEVKLKKPERNILLIYGESKLLSLQPPKVLLPHRRHLIYTVPLFWYVIQIPEGLHFIEY